MKLFIIEDDEGLAGGMAFALEREGYQVVCFRGCGDSRRAFERERPDAVLLDWNLPDGDGLELCREFRELSGVPILMVTARDMEMDEVMCLECGADDYIAKPFSLAVLKARVAALLRRKERIGQRQLCSGDIRVDEGKMKAFKGGEELELSLTEFRLLKYLLENRNQVLLKEQILESVWDAGGIFVEENTLPVNIRRLRLKIEEDPSAPRRIKTVHGMGYLWEDLHE
ncbi:MAG: response regulator transcription factor [Eubacteriales bacterium]|nr:response regulator transcription factor [Eubacteriales bacterium]